jgi:hypothetical protein
MPKLWRAEMDEMKSIDPGTLIPGSMLFILEIQEKFEFLTDFGQG